MQFSLSALAYICALVTFVTASPFAIRDIASCEVAEAAQQVACIGGCANNAACITACTATAVAGYTGCAGVKRDVQSCENYVTAAEITCVDACPADKNGKTNAACVAACQNTAEQSLLNCQ